MTNSLFDYISKEPNNATVSNEWINGQTGMIVDLKGDFVFRFIDYINDNGELRTVHITENSKLKCPVVARGLVGYWLHKKDTDGIKKIFDSYYELRLNEYVKAHEFDDNAWNRDLNMEFVCLYHIPTEKEFFKATEVLLNYITEIDQKKVKSIMDNYLKYARAKRKELFPPNHPANRIIEDTFLDAYRVGGPAHKCMEWMRTEYNLPKMGPHWNIDTETLKEKLSDKMKERHERLIPEYIAEKYEDFDYRVLIYPNGGLIDEIHENIQKCQTQEDRIRYIISLLQPFKEFAEAFYPKARMDERERSIIEHEKWIKKLEDMSDSAVDEHTGEPIRPKDQIATCKKIIEKYKKDMDYWKQVQNDFYWFAQHGLGAGQYRIYPQEVNDKMCEYLGGWWHYMIAFARKLASLALFYNIKLMDVQEKCEVYLVWYFNIFDYVDNRFITSREHARKLLDEIESQKQKNKSNDIMKLTSIEEKKESNNKNRKTTQKNTFKPEKQHGVEYPVFSKGSGVTDNHIKALYLQLTSRGWISTQTKLIDFQDLFTGNSNKCEIIWLGQDKIGNNEPTVLGVSALYVLFKKMADEKLITTGTKSERVGPIIETHFVDSERRFLTSVSNSNKISKVANNCINEILKIMRARLSSEDIQQLLQEEMQSTYDTNDRQNMGYRKPH